MTRQQTKAELIEEVEDLRERIAELERRIETGDANLKKAVDEGDRLRREATKWETYHAELKAEADKRLGELRVIVATFAEVKEPTADIFCYPALNGDDASTELGRFLRALYRLTSEIEPKTAVTDRLPPSFR